MPLLDSDQATGMDVEEGGYRPRTSSGGFKDFLFRKNRHKSDVTQPVSSSMTLPSKHQSGNHVNSTPKVIVPSGKMKTPSPTAMVTVQPQPSAFNKQPPTPTGKVKNIWNAIRPRSKSDAASMQPGGSRVRSRTLEFDDNGSGNHGSHSNHGSHGNHVPPLSNSDMDMLAKSPPSGSSQTLMAKLQAGHLHGSTSSGHQDSNHMNPQEFVEAYRQRAYTDPKAQARAAAVAKYKQKKEHAEYASGSPLARSFSGHSAFLNNLDSHHLIIWRDKNRSTQVFKLPSTDEENDMEVEDLEANEDLVFAKFMRAHKCYDLIPTSSKLVVMDTKMNVKKAFYALVYNGVRAAPLFDSEKQDFVGMLTITDFIKILQKYYQSPLVKMGQLEDHLIETWREELECDQPLVYIDPDQSLFEAIKMLIQFRVHRLPVIDRYAGNALYILTHKRILRFLYLYIHDLPLPSFLNRTLEELNIGTYKDIATATMKTPLITAIDHFVSKRISALPIIDEEGCVVDLYAKFDVINLAAEKTYNNLDVTLKEAMKNRQDRQTGFQNVQTCRKTEKFKDIMERIVKAEVHRLIVVDVDRHVLGIVSLSDILSYLVLRPTNELQVPLMSPLSGKGDDDDTRL